MPEEFLAQLRVIGQAVKMTRERRDASFPTCEQFRATPKPPGNLACFKPAKLLSLEGARELPPNGDWHVARYGVDGDPRSFAQASNEWPWTYQVDLDEPYEVKRLVIRFGRNFATEYDARLSTDGKHWKQVSDRDDAIGATARLCFDPTPCRYVQIRGHKPDGPGQVGYQMSIAELEVYAAGANQE